MANNSEILRILREATLSEAKPIGLAKTDKIIGQSKGENDAYYKDVKKKMSDYEKASTSSMEGAIEEPKFNYENNDEVEYHEDMEILNGMEMLNYERKPSEKFTQRAKEAIEGSSNMGNNPEWANVYPEQKGFTGPDFGKKLVDRIERSKKKRDAATPTLDQFGDDIEEKNVGVNKSKSAYKPSVSKKPVAIGESVIKEADKKTFTIKYWLHMKNDETEQFEKEVEAETAEEAMDEFKKTKLGKSARKPRIVENVPVKPKVKQEPNKRSDVPVSPAERKTAPPKVRQQDNPITESEVDPRNTHFLVEKESGKILHGYDYTDEGPEYAKDAIKDMAKDDIRDMGRNPRDIKVMTKQGLIKQGIDPMDTKNWVESASVDMGENYNKNTNESKMKGKQINELSPSTYDKAAQAGKDRGDSRGQKIASTAEELKYREANALSYMAMILPSGRKIGGGNMELSIIGNPANTLDIIQNKFPAFIVRIKNNKVVEASSSNIYGANLEFTKKTAVNLAKAVKLITGYDISPNIFPQFVEEKQTTTEGFMDFFRGKKTNKQEVVNQLTSLIIPTGKLTGNMANSAIKSINTFNSIMKNIEASDKKLFAELSRIAENLAPDEFGINRSTKDNGVASFDNLYLGNVFGLFTKSLDYWVDSAKTDAEVATIIGNQLSKWVNSNINAAIKKLSDNNKNTNESTMKRLKFKKSFNGVETALKVIPETYKVNNKVFELTDGNEHYRVRWEGSLNEGKAVVLSSFHQESLNEDVAKIKHLMGFKSQNTLGNLKGGQRLTEDKTFFEMLKKTKALNEAKVKPDFLDLDKDGDKKEPMKQAAKDAKSTKKKGIQEYAPDYDNPYDDHSPLPEEWEFILYNGKEIDTNDKYLLDTILDTIGLTFYDSNGLYEPLTTSLGETISVDDTHPEIQRLQPRLLAIANKLNTGVAPDEKDTKLVDAILDKYYTYVDKWEPIDHTMDEAKAKPDFLDLDKDGDKKEPMKKAAKEKAELKEEYSVVDYFNDYDASKTQDPHNKGIKAYVVIDDEKDGSKTKRTIWIESEKDVREDLNAIMSDTQAINSLRIVKQNKSNKDEKK